MNKSIFLMAILLGCALATHHTEEQACDAPVQPKPTRDSLGRHILVEFEGCNPEYLNNGMKLNKEFIQAARQAGATVLDSIAYEFEPFGASCIVLLSESHLSIHAWPELGYGAADLYTCGEGEPWEAFNFLTRVLECDDYSAVEVKRGMKRLMPEPNQEFVAAHINDKNRETGKSKKSWVYDMDDGYGVALQYQGDRLYLNHSDFQLVEVFDTLLFGNMLMIDNKIMTTQKDEFIYHELITHTALLTHPNPKRVLIIGGGDGGTAREVLKHTQLEKIVQVEIDAAVVEASKLYIPETAVAYENPRLELIIGDGIDYIKKAEDESFDIILVDSTDPFGPGEILFTEGFYSNVYRTLTKDGILITQSESPVAALKYYKRIYKTYYKLFGKDNVHSYTSPVPTYATGAWSFAFCSKGSVNPMRDLDDNKANDFARENNLKFFDAAQIRAQFTQPKYIRDILEELRAEVAAE